MRLEQLQARRNAATSLERSSSIPPYSGPPCCGTGCAVCVLDYWEPDEFEIPARETIAVSSGHNHESRPCNLANEITQAGPPPDTPADLPDCCNTGCAVCVRDYPEYFSRQRSESQSLAMLEAIEQALAQAQRLIANQDGDSQ